MSTFQREGATTDSRNHDKNSGWIELKDQSLIDIYQLLQSGMTTIHNSSVFNPNICVADSISFSSVEVIIEQARLVTDRFRSLEKRCVEMGRIRSEEIEQA